jgi:structural maintenance of chromosome 2
LELKFDLPSEDFDRSLVRGRVANLFQIKEERYYNALEAIAGNKLYYIVVDNDVVASLLLKNNCFKYRVNLIPNNKIESRDVKQEVVDYVRNVARGKAKFAQELITYHIHVANTMKYIFGNVIICEDSDTAKKLAFDPLVKMKTVTLAGDIYNPVGVVEGGHSEELYGILKKVKEIKILEEDKRH